MLNPIFFLACLSWGVAKAASTPGHLGSLEDTDCQLKCPQSTVRGEIVLPSITQTRRDTGEWENILECWSIDTTTVDLPGIDSAFRLNWEGGFDAVYQYVFYEQSYMAPHPGPGSSLVIMASGIGMPPVSSDYLNQL